jgi:hypothetical protein
MRARAARTYINFLTWKTSECLPFDPALTGRASRYHCQGFVFHGSGTFILLEFLNMLTYIPTCLAGPLWTFHPTAWTPKAPGQLSVKSFFGNKPIRPDLHTNSISCFTCGASSTFGRVPTSLTSVSVMGGMVSSRVS